MQNNERVVDREIKGGNKKRYWLIDFNQTKLYRQLHNVQLTNARDIRRKKSNMETDVDDDFARVSSRWCD